MTARASSEGRIVWVHRLAGAVRGLAFSPDGRTLYSADNACRIYAWDVAARTRRMVLKHGFVSGVVPDGLTCAGRFVVFGCSNPLQAWDFTAGAERIKPPPRFTGICTRVDAPRGRLLVLGSDGKSVQAWDLARRNRGPAVARWAEPVREAWRNAFHLSADGRTLAVEAKRGEMIFRDVPSGAEIGRMPPRDEWITAYKTLLSPDGRSLWCVTRHCWGLWDVPVGTLRREVCPWPLAFHPTAPVCVVKSPDGFALFDVRAGEPLREFDFGLGEARHACFSPDGLTCAVGGSNKQFAVFDVDV